jgi:hypothetical protein
VVVLLDEYTPVAGPFERERWQHSFDVMMLDSAIQFARLLVGYPLGSDFAMSSRRFVS